MAQIFDLSLVRAAFIAEIVEEDENLEVLGQYLAFVLADVFGTQLHLASVDVVAVLDKTSVEHDPTESIRRKALVSEQYFDVPTHGPSFTLRIAQHKICPLLICGIRARHRVGEQPFGLEALTLVHLEVWGAPVSGQSRDVLELNATQAFDAWRLDLLPVEGFEVIQVPQLARLANTFATSEPLVAIEA